MVVKKSSTVTSQSATKKMTPASRTKTSNREANVLQSAQLGIEVGYQLKRAYIKVVEQFHVNVAPFGLRPSEYSLLCIVDENVHVTAKKLSQALSIAPPNMVNLIDSLIQRQLITKAVNPDDRRSQIIQITPTGKNLLSQAQTASQHAQEIALQHLDKKDQASLIELLRKIYQ